MKKDKVQIVWPKPHVTTGVPFVVAGRAHKTIIGVFAKCRLKSSPHIVVEGTPITFYAPEWNADPYLFYRWMIVFNKPFPDGDYKLTVTGLTKSCSKKRGRRDLKVGTAGTATAFITIDSHTDGQNITEEKDEFVASGALSDQPLGAVRMNNREPVHSFGDHVDLRLWTAQFATLPPDTYTLHAENSSGNPQAEVNGLVVDPPTSSPKG